MAQREKFTHRNRYDAISLLSGGASSNSIHRLRTHVSSLIDIDIKCYGHRYKDLANMQDDEIKLQKHFGEVGFSEGRDPYCPSKESVFVGRRRVHLKVVMRTYHKQMLNIIGSLSSIIVAAENREDWLNVSIVVLNTGNDKASHDELAALVKQVTATLHGASSRRISIEIRPWIFDADQTYGYMASDLELDIIKKESVHRPDYVLFCNGDTYYAEETFDSARFYLEVGVDMIGMNWLPTSRHIGSESQRRTIKQCSFSHGSVDLNGVFLNVEAIIHADASFSSLHSPCAQAEDSIAMAGCRAIDTRPYFVADWGFFHQLMSNRASFICLYSRALFLQN